MSVYRIANSIYKYLDNFGIGTTAPTHKLHIYSTSNNDNDYESAGILLDNATQGEAAIAFRNQNVGANVWVMGLNSNSTRLDIGYGAQTTQLADASVDMCIDTGGNVGIGTTLPRSKLHVEVAGGSGQYTPAMTLINNTSGSISTGIDFSTYGITSAQQPSARIEVIDSGYSGSFAFLSKSFGAIGNSLVERMRIDVDGSVGIGTTAPDGILNIYNSSTVRLNIKSSSAQTQIFAHSDGKSYIQSQGDIVFTGINSSAVRTLYLSTTGSVGIGTTAPNYPLHVNGSIYASSYQNIQPTDISNSLGYTPINQIIRFVSNFTNASTSVTNVTGFIMPTNMTCHFVFDFTWNMSTAAVPQLSVAATVGTVVLNSARLITYETDALVLERGLTLGTNQTMITTGTTGTFLSRVIGWVTNSSGASATFNIRAKSNLATTTLTIGSGTLTVMRDNGQISF